MPKPTIAEIMTRELFTCRIDERLDAVAGRMWERDVGALVVVDDDDKPIAMVTDRDVAMAAYTQGRALDQVHVGVAMSDELCVVRDDTTVEAAQRAMQNNRVRRLPVIDDSGHAVGLVSLADLAWYAAPHANADITPAEVLVTLRALCEPRAQGHEAIAAQ